MTIIVTLKFIHYLAIVFSGGVLVGGGVIQSVYAKLLNRIGHEKPLAAGWPPPPVAAIRRKEARL